MERLALVADTHAYQAGLPALLAFFRDQGLRHLACLGDCPPEPFRPWLHMDPGNRLYWVYDVFGPQLPEATGCGVALELEGLRLPRAAGARTADSQAGNRPATARRLGFPYQSKEARGPFSS